MSCTGPSCMSRTIRCSSRSLVARRRREAARASASRGPVTVHHVRFHGKILGQAQAVRPRRRLDVPRLDPLPELAIVVAAGERRRVLLGLVFEDGEDLRPQLVLGERHRSEEHTSELQSRLHLVCRLLLEKKKKYTTQH